MSSPLFSLEVQELRRPVNAHTISVRWFTSIKDIKDQLHRIINCPPARMQLYHSSRSKCLSNQTTLHDLGIDQDGYVLRLALTLTSNQQYLLVPSKDIQLNYDCEEMMEQVHLGLRCGHKPSKTDMLDCTGGVYFMKAGTNRPFAVFKPNDEEQGMPNNPKGHAGNGEVGLRPFLRPGEGYIRETASYILDFGNFCNVPPTTIVHCEHDTFHYRHNQRGEKPTFPKLGSLQKFVAASETFEDISPSKVGVLELQKIALLDMRLLNCDRNASNILLVRKPIISHSSSNSHRHHGNHASKGRRSESLTSSSEDAADVEEVDFQEFLDQGDSDDYYFRRTGTTPVGGTTPSRSSTAAESRNNGSSGGSGSANRFSDAYDLIPIDHGYCLPTKLQIDEFDWAWYYTPHVAAPVAPEIKEYMQSLDIDALLSDLTRQIALPDDTLFLLRLTHQLLVEGINAGLTLRDIASLIARTEEDVPSALENAIAAAEDNAVRAIEMRSERRTTRGAASPSFLKSLHASPARNNVYDSALAASSSSYTAAGKNDELDPASAAASAATGVLSNMASPSRGFVMEPADSVFCDAHAASGEAKSSLVPSPLRPVSCPLQPHMMKTSAAAAGATLEGASASATMPPPAMPVAKRPIAAYCAEGHRIEQRVVNSVLNLEAMDSSSCSSAVWSRNAKSPHITGEKRANSPGVANFAQILRTKVNKKNGQNNATVTSGSDNRDTKDSNDHDTAGSSTSLLRTTPPTDALEMVESGAITLNTNNTDKNYKNETENNSSNNNCYDSDRRSAVPQQSLSMQFPGPVVTTGGGALRRQDGVDATTSFAVGAFKRTNNGSSLISGSLLGDNEVKGSQESTDDYAGKLKQHDNSDGSGDRMHCEDEKHSAAGIELDVDMVVCDSGDDETDRGTSTSYTAAPQPPAKDTLLDVHAGVSLGLAGGGSYSSHSSSSSHLHRGGSHLTSLKSLDASYLRSNRLDSFRSKQHSSYHPPYQQHAFAQTMPAAVVGEQDAAIAMNTGVHPLSVLGGSYKADFYYMEQNSPSLGRDSAAGSMPHMLQMTAANCCEGDDNVEDEDDDPWQQHVPVSAEASAEVDPGDAAPAAGIILDEISAEMQITPATASRSSTEGNHTDTSSISFGDACSSPKGFQQGNLLRQSALVAPHSHLSAAATNTATNTSAAATGLALHSFSRSTDASPRTSVPSESASSNPPSINSSGNCGQFQQTQRHDSWASNRSSWNALPAPTAAAVAATDSAGEEASTDGEQDDCINSADRHGLSGTNNKGSGNCTGELSRRELLGGISLTDSMRVASFRKSKKNEQHLLVQQQQQLQHTQIQDNEHCVASASVKYPMMYPFDPIIDNETVVAAVGADLPLAHIQHGENQQPQKQQPQLEQQQQQLEQELLTIPASLSLGSMPRVASFGAFDSPPLYDTSLQHAERQLSQLRTERRKHMAMTGEFQKLRMVFATDALLSVISKEARAKLRDGSRSGTV